MTSRSFRLETRSRARDELKRIMQTVEKVRKWEKIWIETGLSNHLKVYKWVPVREEAKEEVKEDGQASKENQSQAVGEAASRSTRDQASANALLPEIRPAMDRVTTLEAPRLSADQLPPDLLLASDENTRDDSPTTGTSVTNEEVVKSANVGMATAGVDSSVATGDTATSSQSDNIQQEVDLQRRKERQGERQIASQREDDSRPRSPH